MRVEIDPTNLPGKKGGSWVRRL